MPAKGFLTAQQLKKLQTALRESETAQLRERILMLLLMNDGKTYREISDFIGCSERTVVYWCVHGDPDNLESLRDGREQGNYQKVTPAYIQLLMETIEKAPDEFGYEFGRWTTARLATYLAGVTGIELSGGQVRRILKKSTFTFGQNTAWKTNKTKTRGKRLRKSYKDTWKRQKQYHRSFKSGFGMRVVSV
jgi:transposase